MKGRKPTPTQLKIIAGNPGKRQLNENEPIPEISGDVPSAPEYLSGAARLHWDECARKLHPIGLLTGADYDLLARYCDTHARWVDAQEQLRNHGVLVKTQSGFPAASPYVGINNKCIELLNKMCVELGMTPSSRSRIAVPKKKTDSKFTQFKQG